MPHNVPVDSSFLFNVSKRERKHTSSSPLSHFPLSAVPSMGSFLAACGAARQQVRCGRGRSGGSPNVQSFPLWARGETLAQVAGAGGGRGWQGALAPVKPAGGVIRRAFPGVSRGTEGGGTVVVGPPSRASVVVTVAPQDLDEGQLELAAVARVDDGIQAAVEVAEPEDDFEEGLRWSQVDIERP